jgi:hypothetical protein
MRVPNATPTMFDRLPHSLRLKAEVPEVPKYYKSGVRPTAKKSCGRHATRAGFTNSLASIPQGLMRRSDATGRLMLI